MFSSTPDKNIESLALLVPLLFAPLELSESGFDRRLRGADLRNQLLAASKLGAIKERCWSTTELHVRFFLRNKVDSWVSVFLN